MTDKYWKKLMSERAFEILNGDDSKLKELQLEDDDWTMQVTC